MAEDTVDEGADIQDFILARELAEVYLLLDHISANQTKTIPAILPDEPVFGSIEEQTRKSWIEQVCEIAWPPKETTTSREDAHNAAKLIRAKDVLNNKAYPATGATIAFTVMMAGEAEDAITLPFWRRWLVRLAGFSPEARRRREGEGGRSGWANQRAPSRGGLAARAYPNLATSASFYRFAMYLILALLVGWLMMTCFLSWDVATGSALLNRYNSLDARIVDLRKGTVKPDGLAPSPTATVVVVASPSPTPAPTPTQTLAPAGKPSPTPTPTPGTAADRASKSDVEKAIDQQQAASINLRKWLDSGGWIRNWLIHRMGGGNWDSARATGDAAEARRTNLHVEWAGVALGILANSILPIFYGLLGAGAAVVRIVSAKMRDSTLSPRDIVLAYVRLALGAVIGACIGLFAAPDGSLSSSQPGLLGPIHLSASALCFIAGFSVEGVFQWLESAIARIFNIEPTKTPTPGVTPPPPPPPAQVVVLPPPSPPKP